MASPIKALSIIIIAYNEEKHIPILLKSLKNQTHPFFEVIIVDSNSVDKTAEIAMKYESFFQSYHYLKLDSARGPAYARNKGVEVASNEYIVFLDADTNIHEDFVENIMTELDERKPDIATCKVKITKERSIANAGAAFFNIFMTFLLPFYSSGFGACLITRKEVHNALNGFREDLGVCEDCNYIKRARRKHNFKYRILSQCFYTSDRRAKMEGGAQFIFKFIRIHLFRMITGKEIRKDKITYNYGNFNKEQSS